MRYLHEFAYEPVVVTGPKSVSGRWTPSDQGLEADLPTGIDVRRIDTPVPPAPQGARRRVERLGGLTSSFDRWWIEGAVRAAHGVDEVDVVYASMSPFATSEAAQRLARALGVPWVADLRDPWALDEMAVYPTLLHRRLERRRMERALSSAAALVLNTPAAAAALHEAFPSLAALPVTVIPNGFDAADFAAPVAPRQDPMFRIVHAGYLHTELGLRIRRSRALRLLGSVTRGVDFLTRSHVFLLAALADLLDRRPELRDRIEVHLAGVLSPADKSVVESFPHADLVRMPGYLSHLETVEFMRSADLLFLPMQDLPAGTRARIVPGKLYEYMATGRPILAAVPDGDARDLLARLPQVSLCRPTDVACISTAIEELVDRQSATGRVLSVDSEGLARFERRQLTADLASVLDRAVGREQPAQALAEWPASA